VKSSVDGGSTACCCRHSCARVVQATAVVAVSAICVGQRSTGGRPLGPSSPMLLVWRRHGGGARGLSSA
jgi:hypothetical protein